MNIKMQFEHPRLGWRHIKQITVIKAGERLTDEQIREWGGIDPDAMDERIQITARSLRGPSKADRLVITYASPETFQDAYMIVPTMIIK